MTKPLFLPGNATPWERAVSATSAERYPLDDGALLRFASSETVTKDLLPWLAQQVGVDFWRDYWPEHKKRAVIAAMPRLKSRKGTAWAIRRYLELAGTPAVSMQLPMFGIYLGADVDPDVYAAWLNRLPQVRVYFDREFDVGIYDAFLDVNHADEMVLSEDVAIRRRNHYATIYQDGVESEIVSADVQPTDGPKDLIRISVNPDDVDGFVVGSSMLDGNEYVREDAFFEAAVLTYVDQFDMVPDASERAFETTLSWRPVDSRWAVQTGVHPVLEHESFLDVDNTEGAMVAVDLAHNNVFRRLYVHDPAVPLPMPPNGMPVEGEWIEMPPFHGIIKVDTRAPGNPLAMISGHNFEGYFDMILDATVEDAVEAVQSAQGGTDVFAIDTKIESLPTAGDRFTAKDRVRVGSLIERIS